MSGECDSRDGAKNEDLCVKYQVLGNEKSTIDSLKRERDRLSKQLIIFEHECASMEKIIIERSPVFRD